MAGQFPNPPQSPPPPEAPPPPSAFPSPHYIDVDGMTLLDYFAGQALAGIMANPKFDLINIDIGDFAYTIAENTLNHRSKL